MQSQFGAGRPRLFLKCALAGRGSGCGTVGVKLTRRKPHFGDEQRHDGHRDGSARLALPDACVDSYASDPARRLADCSAQFDTSRSRAKVSRSLVGSPAGCSQIISRRAMEIENVAFPVDQHRRRGQRSRSARRATSSAGARGSDYGCDCFSMVRGSAGPRRRMVDKVVPVGPSLRYLRHFFDTLSKRSSCRPIAFALPRNRCPPV